MSTFERFAELVARPAGGFDLAEAALVLSAGAYPDLDVARWLGDIDRLALGLSDLGQLRVRLFTELGLRGDRETYYRADNSFLHRVLERRRGIPISLSVLTMEVGRRAGLELQGVGMPGHFLVYVPSEGILLDPFDAGAVLNRDEGDPLPIVGPHAILTRMLANLRAIYRANGSASDLEWVLRMRLALPQPSATEFVELGEALAAQGRFLEGARELTDRAAASAPGDAAVLDAAAGALRARLN